MRSGKHYIGFVCPKCGEFLKFPEALVAPLNGPYAHTLLIARDLRVDNALMAIATVELGRAIALSDAGIVFGAIGMHYPRIPGQAGNIRLGDCKWSGRVELVEEGQEAMSKEAGQ